MLREQRVGGVKACDFMFDQVLLTFLIDYDIVGCGFICVMFS